MHFQNLMGLITFSGALLLMLVTVPWEEIKRFAVFGIGSGLAIAVALILMMQNWLGLWVYRQVDFLTLGGIPFFLSVAWTPTEIFFAHFLSRQQNRWFRLVLILFIPGVAVAIHFIQRWNGMLSYHHWNYLGTYLVSLGIHAGLALYLNRAYRIPV